METIYRILSACKTMTLSFSSYIPVVFISHLSEICFFFFFGGGGVIDCSGKVVSTLITWNISFSPPIEFHLGNEQLIMPAPVQLEKLFVI